MSDKLTERDRFFAAEGFKRGYERGHDDTVEGWYNSVCSEDSTCCDEWLDTENQVGATFAGALAEMAPKPEPAWQPIETAPRDGTEILGWRKDAGVLLVRWTCMDAFMTDSEIEESGLDEATTAAEDWFCADFLEGARLDGSEAPTHWMPLPDDPAPAPKIRIDSMDAWVEDEAAGIDEGEA